jgi:hypothetical protein
MIERIEALIEKATYDEIGETIFASHARQLLPLMLEVVKAADELRCNCFAESPLLQFVDGTIEALDAYCAEHLPEVK